MKAAARVPELLLALALDAGLGEPPARVHPVVGMGRLIDALEARLPPPDGDTISSVRAGAVAASVGSATLWACARLAAVAPWPLRGVVLWSLLSGRMLLDEVAAVEDALVEDGLDGGRRQVARVVSRDTSTLTAQDVRGAAVSTLAENLTDSVVATLWWWSLGGLPAAAVHRFHDTLDSRWGYQSDAWLHRGRAAARIDDALAWVPARLTALLWRGRLDATLRTEAGRTPSPNGGWPMAAAALAQDVRLSKPGAYVLHPAGRGADAAAVHGALRDARRVMVLAATLAVAVAAIRDTRDDRRAVGALAGGAT